VGHWKDRGGAEIVDEVKPRKGDKVICKHRNSAFYRTSLERYLRRKNISTLLLTGIATHGCVESTLRDAFFRDFDVVLVDDCCADMSEEGHDSTVRNVRELRL